MHDAIVAFLDRSELFASLTARLRRKLVADMDVITLPAGDLIFAKGDHGDAVYFVLDGEIHLESGGVTVISRGAGECVGEFALFDDGPRSASARTAVPSRLIRWPSIAFRRALDTNPQISAGFFRLLTTKLREDVGTQVGHLLEQQRWRLEMQWAHEVQQGLLPAERARFAGVEISCHWSPADAVGGDLYDYLPLAQGVALFIGDVTGHGVYSALLAAMAKSALHTQARLDASPRAVKQALRRAVQLSIGRRLLMSCIYLVVGWDGRYVYANSGHPPALCLHSKTGRVESLEALDTILGVLGPEADLPRERAGRLEAGDCLVLYTDGLLEAENAEGGQFGLLRLEQLLTACRGESAEQIKCRLLSALNEHRGPVEAGDDTTVMILRYGDAAVRS